MPLAKILPHEGANGCGPLGPFHRSGWPPTDNRNAPAAYNGMLRNQSCSRYGESENRTPFMPGCFPTKVLVVLQRLDRLADAADPVHEHNPTSRFRKRKPLIRSVFKNPDGWQVSFATATASSAQPNHKTSSQRSERDSAPHRETGGTVVEPILTAVGVPLQRKR